MAKLTLKLLLKNIHMKVNRSAFCWKRLELVVGIEFGEALTFEAVTSMTRFGEISPLRSNFKPSLAIT